MTVTYNSSTTATTGSAAASSLVVNTPASITAGMFLVLGVAAAGGTGTTITAPTGWTSYQNNSNSTTIKNQNFYKVATASEPASYTIGFSGSVMAAAACVSYTGAHPFQPIRVSNGSGSGTSISFATVDADWSGKGLDFVATSNTTAANTCGTVANAIQRADVCTTASPYIEIAVYEQSAEHDITASTALSNYGLSAATAPQSVTYQMGGAWLDLAHVPASVQNLSRVGVTGDAIESDVAFGQLALNLAINRGGSQAATTTTSSGIAGTWTLAASYNSTSPVGNLAVFTAVTNTIGGSTVTTNYSGSPVSTYNTSVTVQGAATHGVNGSAAIGATATASTSATAPSVTITTTKPNSMILALCNDATQSSGVTCSGTNVLMPIQSGDGTNSCTAWWEYLPGVIPAAGTPVTIGASSPSTGNCNILAVEILAPPTDSAAFSDHATAAPLGGTDSAAFSIGTPKIAQSVQDSASFTDRAAAPVVAAHDSAAFTEHVSVAVSQVANQGSFSDTAHGVGLGVANAAAFAEHPGAVTVAPHDSVAFTDHAAVAVAGSDHASCTDTANRVTTRAGDAAATHDTALVTSAAAHATDAGHLADAAGQLASHLADTAAFADHAAVTNIGRFSHDSAVFADSISGPRLQVTALLTCADAVRVIAQASADEAAFADHGSQHVYELLTIGASLIAPRWTADGTAGRWTAKPVRRSA